MTCNASQIPTSFAPLVRAKTETWRNKFPNRVRAKLPKIRKIQIVNDGHNNMNFAAQAHEYLLNTDDDSLLRRHLFLFFSISSFSQATRPTFNDFVASKRIPPMSPDLEDLKLWKGRSGESKDRNLLLFLKISFELLQNYCRKKWDDCLICMRKEASRYLDRIVRPDRAIRNFRASNSLGRPFFLNSENVDIRILTA